MNEDTLTADLDAAFDEAARETVRDGVVAVFVMSMLAAQPDLARRIVGVVRAKTVRELADLGADADALRAALGRACDEMLTLLTALNEEAEARQ